MKYYKLLSQEMTSHNNTKWEIGVTITITKKGNRMCTDQVLHCYNHPLLAVILNPVHAKIKNPRLFEIEVDQIVNSDGLKFASKSQTLLKEIPLPEISIEQRIEFGIRVVKLVCKDEKWNEWADKWLSGEDRSRESAYDAAYDAAYADAYAAYYAAYAAYYADSADYDDAADYAARSTACSAIYVANAYGDNKDEFNKQVIDIIEKIVKI